MRDSQTLSIQPYFDLELFLHTAQESRLDGHDLEQCLSLWQEWSGLIKAHTVRAEARPYLALWLDEAIEDAVDTAWEQSPSHSFRLNALAQTLCMAAVHELVPEVEEAGCAPVPQGSLGLAEAVTAAGMACSAAEGVGALKLSRRYAVVTPQPFRGGCEICALRSSCPRSGNDESVLELPGFE